MHINEKIVFRIYMYAYVASAFVMLTTGWHAGGLRKFVLLLSLVIFVTLLLGPFLFYRVLNKQTTTIPLVGEFGPASEHWEWWFYSLTIGLTPIILFLSGALKLATD